jgi:hypothetical protein
MSHNNTLMSINNEEWVVASTEDNNDSIKLNVGNCDGNNSVQLTPDEARLLASKLIVLADELEGKTTEAPRKAKAKARTDELGMLLAKYSIDRIVRVAGVIKGHTLAEKYAHLNPGQQRMSAGNIIRSSIKKGMLTIEDIARLLNDPTGRYHG